MRKLIFALVISLYGCAHVAAGVPDVVPYVDLERYAGQWYEIERYDNSFQRNCLGTRATYTLKGSRVQVLNECERKDRPGQLQSAKGTALVVDKETQAKLKVSFVPLLRHWGVFAGEYWVLELGADYEYALVGDSKREYLWILSRTPTLDNQTLEYLKMKADELGFDSSKLLKTATWKSM